LYKGSPTFEILISATWTGSVLKVKAVFLETIHEFVGWGEWQRESATRYKSANFSLHPLVKEYAVVSTVDSQLHSFLSLGQYVINLLTPNVNYSGRTAPLNSKVAFYIFIQQI